MSKSTAKANVSKAKVSKATAAANAVGADGLTPQQRANQKQNEKRKNMARLPSAYLDESEAKLVETLGKIAGNKRAAIFQGLALLEAKYRKEGKLPGSKNAA